MAKKELSKALKKRGAKFSNRLKKERKKQNLSQMELSKLSDISLDTIRAIEHGKISAPGLFIAASLVHSLGGKLDKWVLDK